MGIGLGYILPMIVLHAWELLKVRLDIGGHSKTFLQNCIVTKYLNYNEESRQEVDVADVQIAVRENAGELAESYTAVLAILRLLGKLFVILCFTLQETPRSLKYVLIMPLLMLIFGFLRNSVLSDAYELPNELGARVLAFVADLAKNYRLIANYHNRPKINDMFAHKAHIWRASLLNPYSVRVNNHFFTQWLGPVFIGVYIISHAPYILSGELGHGTFVAMLSVFSEISEDFSEGYMDFLKITSMGGTLRYLTFMLNRDTDLFQWKAVNRKRRAATQQARERIYKEQANGAQHKFPTDLIQFEFRNVGYSVKDKRILQNISLTVPQGVVVAITGQHGQARQTFLKLIGHEIFPTEGEIFIPSHLRILHVSQEV